MLNAFKMTRAALLGAVITTSAGGLCSTALADEVTPLHYLNIQTIEPQTRAAFINAMRNNATQSRKEAANIVFDVAEPGGNDPTLVLFESWRDRFGYQQHEASAHVAPVLALVPTSFAKPERKYLLQDVPGLPGHARKDIDHPSATKNIVERFEIKPSERQRFIQAAAQAIQDARQQPDNLVFDVYQVQKDDNTFVIYQRWSEAAAYENAQARPAAKTLNLTIKTSQASAPEVLSLRDRIID